MMSILAQTARAIGFLICVIAVIFYSSAVFAAIIAFGVSDSSSLSLGRFLGALFADLLFLAMAIRFWKGLRRNR